MFIRYPGYYLYGLCILDRSSIHWLAVHQTYPANQASVKTSTSFKVTSKTEAIVFLFCFTQKTPFFCGNTNDNNNNKSKTIRLKNTI